MHPAVKYAFFLLFPALSFQLRGQNPATPSGLAASYKKYTNRIELSWQATASDHRYIIQRRDPQRKTFVALDTVAQNRYVDRNKLQTNRDYGYRVQSLDRDGRISVPSKDAVGALLVVADTKKPQEDSIHIENCMQFSITESRATPTLFLLKFLAKTSCAKLPEAAQLTLYFSQDSVLDDADSFLARQEFRLSRTRGAMSAKNVGQEKSGYLILRVEAKGSAFTVSRKVE